MRGLSTHAQSLTYFLPGDIDTWFPQHLVQQSFSVTAVVASKHHASDVLIHSYTQ